MSALHDSPSSRSRHALAVALLCLVLGGAVTVPSAADQGSAPDKDRTTLQAALAKAPDIQTQVDLLEALGENYRLANEMARAEASFRSALDVGEAAWGESLRVAGTLSKLGFVLRLQNRLDEAERLHRRALEIRQRLAPDSLDVAESLHQLFLVVWTRDDLEAMSDYVDRALSIQKRWPSDTLAMADTLSDLALLDAQRGHFAEAAENYQRALAIFQQRSPESIDMATDLARLGLTYRSLGDSESAREVLHHALQIRERLAPESLGTGSVLNELSTLARESGRLDEATDLLQRAMRIWQKNAPNGYGVAEGLDAQGIIERLRGHWDEAWSLHTRALAIRRQLPNHGDRVAYTLNLLGMVAEGRGDLPLAIDYFQQAYEIFKRLAPGTIREAHPLQRLGVVSLRMRRLDQAEHFLQQAVEVLENQAETLGGLQDLRSIFRANNEDFYRDAITVELELGHTAEAFHLLERSRARSFLTLLAERDLAFPGEVPEALERSRRDNATRYDQILRQLERWVPNDGDEARESLRGELSRLRQERDEISVKIRQASPRLAALRQPQPLDLAAAQKVLDPGTLALSYSVGKEQTLLFAVTRDGGLRVKTLSIGEDQLRGQVEDLLKRIRAQEAPVDLAHSLYRTLIDPVADLAEGSTRILILPDGPLHRLPFSALMRTTKGREQYLAEWKPLHTALSLTTYATLRASSNPAASIKPAQLVAFGDPSYPQNLAAASASRDPLHRTFGLSPRSFNWQALPYSRREVETIAAAYPGSHLYLGKDATEEKAKSVARNARILHFATHGYLDDRTPLDSALVLTIPEDLPPGRDNGLLQVWEIFESVRLDADLVVLSACESALGRELSGEGMIGLTRAFQYAGARSVVASLWDVADQTTAELMTRFHRHYAAGLSKDEALRQAQIELIRQPIRITTAAGQSIEIDASAPFFWAAFELFGDWK
jgi:CHAT domain-containing protein/Tfp pilus assembly protein PilF